jgi:mannosyltransferase
LAGGARKLEILILGGVTLAAFAFRVAGIDQSLFGDELYTYAIATQDGLRGAYDVMQQVENNPPLFYLLAWAMAKLGDPTLTIRIPSLVLSTATAPVIYLLGRRTLGGAAGLLGAAFFALSPFAIFYGSEARAYALLLFLVALSTLLLIVALESARRRWLVLYAICAGLMIYTHYTGFYVLGAQALWGLWAHRERAFELVVAYAAIALAYIPWVPSYLDQPPFRGWLGAEPWTFEETFRSYVIAFIGHTYTPLDAVPGRFAVTLLVATVAVAVGGAAVAFLSRPPSERRVAPGVVLIGLLTLSTPLGLLVYSAFEPDAYGPRNLNASLPGLCLLLGALFTARTRLPRGALAGAALVACAIGTVAVLDSDRDRPPFKRAAEVIDAEDGGQAAVLEYPLFGPAGPTGRSLEVNLERAHAFFKTSLDDRSLPDRVAGKDTLFVVAPWIPPWRGAPLPQGLDQDFRLAELRVWPSWIPVALLKYQRRT